VAWLRSEMNRRVMAAESTHAPHVTKSQHTLGYVRTTSVTLSGNTGVPVRVGNHGCVGDTGAQYPRTVIAPAMYVPLHGLQRWDRGTRTAPRIDRGPV
jgi:hypothetical protein